MRLKVQEPEHLNEGERNIKRKLIWGLGISTLGAALCSFLKFRVQG